MGRGHPLLPPQRPSGKGATEQEGGQRAWSSPGRLQGGPRLGLAPAGRRSVSSQEGKYRKRNTSRGPVTEDQTRRPGPASAGGGGGGAARVRGGLGTASPQRWARWSRPACSPRAAPGPLRRASLLCPGSGGRAWVAGEVGSGPEGRSGGGSSREAAFSRLGR